MNNLLSIFKEQTKLASSILSHEDAESFELGGVFVKVMSLKRGDLVVTHSHKYSHAHILGKGRIMLEVDGEQTEYVAPAVIEIEAGKNHGILAVEDSIGFCVHNTSVIDAVAF